MITRWLGSDSPNIVPSIVEHEPPGAAIVLLCSDGLWNYASSLPHLRRILDDTIEDLLEASVASSEGSATSSQEVPMVAIAEALCSFALESGGQDNISIALLRMGPPILSWSRATERVPKVEFFATPGPSIESSPMSTAVASKADSNSLDPNGTDAATNDSTLGSERIVSTVDPDQLQQQSQSETLAAQADVQQGDTL